MHFDPSTPPLAGTEAGHELRFVSLHDPGRWICVPCDPGGQVDIDALAQRLRMAYLSARALIGRDYAYPTVHLLEPLEAAGP